MTGFGLNNVEIDPIFSKISTSSKENSKMTEFWPRPLVWIEKTPWEKRFLFFYLVGKIKVEVKTLRILKMWQLNLYN